MNESLYEGDRLATRKEFTEGLIRQKMGDTCERSGVPLLCENDSVYVDAGDGHTLIFGNTGTKKTRNFIIPTVYMLGNAGESMVITDPKGEIYASSSGFLAAQGYVIQVLNLRDLESSDQWNPLAIPYYFYTHDEKDKAMEMVSDLAAQLTAHHSIQPFWENSGRSVLEGIILLLFEYCDREEDVTMGNVIRILSHLNQIGSPDPDSSEAKDKGNSFWNMLDSLPSSSMIRVKLANIMSVRDTYKTLSSIISVVNQMTAPFELNHALLRMLSDNGIDMVHTGERRTALFLIIPDEKRTLHFLASVFIKQLYEMLIFRAQMYAERSLPVRVNFILDEFANLTQIHDMSSMISAARSRNIRFTLVVQSKAQLEDLYPESEAETIKSNCATWIVLPCRELALLEEISDLCGTVRRGERGAEEPLLDVNDLQDLEVGWKDGQALVLRRGVYPYIAWVVDFEYYPQTGCPPVPFQPQKQRKDPVLTLDALRQLVRTKDDVDRPEDEDDESDVEYEIIFEDPEEKPESEKSGKDDENEPLKKVVAAAFADESLKDRLGYALPETEEVISSLNENDKEDLPYLTALYIRSGEAWEKAQSQEVARESYEKAWELSRKLQKTHQWDNPACPRINAEVQAAGIRYARLCCRTEKFRKRGIFVYWKLYYAWEETYQGYGENKTTGEYLPLPEELLSTRPFFILLRLYDELKTYGFDNTSGYYVSARRQIDQTAKHMVSLTELALPCYSRDIELLTGNFLERLYEWCVLHPGDDRKQTEGRQAAQRKKEVPDKAWLYSEIDHLKKLSSAWGDHYTRLFEDFLRDHPLQSFEALLRGLFEMPE